jgi:hypothetical protein
MRLHRGRLVGSPARPQKAALAVLAIGPRAITMLPTEAEHAANVRTLLDEGLTGLTAGQQTGRSGLTVAETFAAGQPGSGHSAEAMNKLVMRQYMNAALRRVGEAGPVDAPRLTSSEVVDGAFDRIGNSMLR